jgi:ribosome-binding factor A
MSARRMARVTELIRQEVSKHLIRLQDPSIGFITVIGVRLSPDFAQARVFYSVYGTPDEKARAQKVLDKSRQYLYAQLGKLESLKVPPELEFVLDESAEEVQNVLGVLSELEKERLSHPDKPE